METDSNGFIYRGNTEQEAIVQYNPQNSTTTTFVRDPRINWVDTSECFHCSPALLQGKADLN